MTPADAVALLTEQRFVPGASSTHGMAPDLRSLVKAALRLVRRKGLVLPPLPPLPPLEPVVIPLASTTTSAPVHIAALPLEE